MATEAYIVPSGGAVDSLDQHFHLTGVADEPLEDEKTPEHSPQPLRLPISIDDNDCLVVSPYTTALHKLRLSRVDIVPRLVAVALSQMHPVLNSYALAKCQLAFNWNEVFTLHLSRLAQQLHDALDHDWPIGTAKAFYVVHFRSQLKADVDRDALARLDQKSHEEAMASGGLLKYWFGSPDASRRNLATCIWRSEEDAIAGGKGPWHGKARQFAPQAYKEIAFTRLWLSLTRLESGITWYFDKAVR